MWGQTGQKPISVANNNFPYGEKEDYRPRDYQVGGNHYSKHSIQPIDIIREYKLDFFEGNALKYLLRYKDKNGIQDLDKAIDYINMVKDSIRKEKDEQCLYYGVNN